MRITLKLFATLGRYLPPGSQGYACHPDVPDGTPVAELLKQFDIPIDGTAVILVNGLTADPPQVLQEGDTVAVFPAMAGG
ncbi:MAG: MoaD/ThiS family protein [Anaerolineae bacterium]|jgi:sulfur carrier protein ThiS